MGPRLSGPTWVALAVPGPLEPWKRHTGPQTLLSGPSVGVADLLISVSPLGSFPFLMGNTCLQLGRSILLPIECLQFVPCVSRLIQSARVSAEIVDWFQTYIFMKQLSSHTGALSRTSYFL